MAADLVARIKQRVEAYRSVPAPELMEGVEGNVVRGLTAMRECRGPTREERAASAEVGAVRARQGLPVEATIEAFQLCVDELCRSVLGRARQLGATSDDMLEIVQGAWAWANFMMTSAAREHRRVDIEAARRDAERHAAFVEGVVLGSLGPTELAAGFTTYRLDPAARYRVVGAGAHDDTRLQALRLQIERANHQGPGSAVAIVQGELFGVLARVPHGDLAGVCLGVSGPDGLERAAARFAEASQALAAAQAFGLEGMHDLDSLGLLVAVRNDPALAERLFERHLAALQDGPIPATLRTLLACDLHVGEAAHRLFVHPNTVRKRVARYESLTGADLGRIDDLVELWWALRHDEARRRRRALP